MGEWTAAAMRRRAEIDAQSEMAQDLMTLLSALPPGIRRQLEKDETCGAILEKYLQEVI